MNFITLCSSNLIAFFYEFIQFIQLYQMKLKHFYLFFVYFYESFNSHSLLTHFSWVLFDKSKRNSLKKINPGF